MISSRWRKVLRDLWQNKGRSLLVVLSIAVGVFAVGTVVHMRFIVRQDMVGSYEGAHPAHATLYTEDTFDEDLIEVIREMPFAAQCDFAARLGYDALEVAPFTLTDDPRTLTPGDVEQSDRIYVMTKAHRELVNSWVPEARDRVALLDPQGQPVPAPTRL